ncbi:transcriptional repressor [candidate division KSB1 bacterium]|nr:transcriptional repressor [candidate division KSB1 bacterium]
MEKYKQILVSNGIKPTYHRIKILEYLDQNKTHPTADMIYLELFKTVPTLSKTTVYNTMDVLQQHHLVKALSITETELRYEFQGHPHQHLLCRVCGEIFDVYWDCQRSQLTEIEGHRIESRSCYLKGICRNCLVRMKRNDLVEKE